MVELLIGMLLIINGIAYAFSEIWANKVDSLLDGLLKRETKNFSTSMRVLTGIVLTLIGLMFVVSALTR